MFIGDSLSLNQWQSLLCMLHTATPHSEYKPERIGPLSTFTFTVRLPFTFNLIALPILFLPLKY